MNAQPRVGLVLGAGGVLGGAWLVGALHAITTETGWDPASADYIVGTSAGSMIGALIACGVPPWFIVDRSAGETFDGLTDVRDSLSPADLSGTLSRFYRSGFVPWPGSWRLALASLSHPQKYPPGAVIAGWLPQGFVSTEPLKEVVRRVCPTGWAPHPNFWSVAVDYATGGRVVFGRANSPEAELHDAVAASCAVPGFYRNVAINGRSYVDGGVHSTSNLDLLRDESLDLVVVLNPMSSLHPGSPRSLTERLAAAVRREAGRRLAFEAKLLGDAGIETVLIEPTADDVDAMGINLMSERRRHQVVQTAVRAITRYLRDSSVSARLAEVAGGDRLLARGPDQPEPTWLGLSGAAHERWTRARAA